MSSHVLHPEARGYESPLHLSVNIYLKYKSLSELGQRPNPI